MNDWADILRWAEADGKVSQDALIWLRVLVAYINALEARIAALE